MASGSYKQVYVLCPFYKWDDGKENIICEGLVDDSSIAAAFFSKADYEQHIIMRCCGQYDKCDTYKALLEKYEE